MNDSRFSTAGKPLVVTTLFLLFDVCVSSSCCGKVWK